MTLNSLQTLPPISFSTLRNEMIVKSYTAKTRSEEAWQAYMQRQKHTHENNTGNT